MSGSSGYEKKGKAGRQTRGNTRGKTRRQAGRQAGRQARRQAGSVQENRPEYVKKRRFARGNSRDFGTPDRNNQSMAVGRI